MPFTVSCAACDSRFLLGDDLFRRKVSGKVVTVRCRKCNAEISVDATEPATLPSQEEPPRRARPVPPRPKQSATGTPLPATGTPLPITATPLPRKAPSATVTPLPTDALLSIWDAADKNAAAPRKAPPPRPHAQTRVQANEPELIDDIEEVPPSSSDAPSLTTLTHETNPKKPTAPKKKPPDDFLMNLSAGTGGILGAPTIDLLGLASPPPPDVEELLEIEATEVTPRAGTVPLFDMSAVLPVANGAKASSSTLSPSHMDLSIDVEMPQTSSEGGKSRERKYVVAPNTPAEATAPKARRAGAAVWFVLVAAAASVLLVVGLRDHASSRHGTPEPESAEHPPSITETTPTSPAAPTVPATVATETPPTPIAVDPLRTGKPSGAPAPSTVTTSVKSSDTPKASAPEQPKAETTPTVEKPSGVEKPSAPAPKIEAKPEPADPGTEFDRASAVAALKAAAAEAAACRKDGDPSGTASLTITFAPSGRVTSANIQGPPFAGTPTGGCIANAMRHAHVPAFSGDRVTVNKTIVIQ